MKGQLNMTFLRKKKKSLLAKVLIVFFILLIIIGVFFLWQTYSAVQNVKKWQEDVDYFSEQYGIADKKEIVYAIILTESKGKQIDIMQSSESKYGTPNEIKTSEESIESGVSFLADAFKRAKKEGCDDWTAVQAYNFGLDYITYVSEHGGKTTLELADTYSKTILSPMLGNDSEETYRYYHPQALIYNGGNLYRNGGNLFYAKIVHWNLDSFHAIESVSDFIKN